ncbi:hypothetical protein SPI_06676 [Niveomyces insectorum RCEF 264]|uniref:Ankyrin 2,3/unc44 n=1 Tax=Niveomyces insectorum RCEF 264 TaxID=1081102 RepID=A0A167RHK4_9HYPO|nr:hypothetical protein SPI_06676 [Niveomyces insectorum RCEF 264]
MSFSEVATAKLYGAQRANDEVRSRPVDLDQVAARLHALSGNEAAPEDPPRSQRCERSPTVDVDWHELQVKDETAAYNDLVRDGGRPAYPIDILADVLENPASHQHILRPWQNWSDVYGNSDVFERQLRRWQDFRNWQEDNREIVNKDELFAAFVEKEKHKDAEDKAIYWRHLETSHMTGAQYLEKLRAEFGSKQRRNSFSGRDEEEEFAGFVEETKQKDLANGHVWPGMTEDEHVQTIRTRFDRQQNLRYWYKFYWLREDHGRGGFGAYVQEAKRRLARYGFTRAFEVDKDPRRQDKLTEWVEYLNYEYTWHDKYTRIVKREKLVYEEAWTKLADSGVLRPGETEETIRTDGHAFGRQAEKDRAAKAVKAAEAAARAALVESEKAKSGRSRFTTEQRKRNLVKVTAKLVAARKTQTTLIRRSELIREFILATYPYRDTKKRISSHGFLLQWILDQVPLIEAEMAKLKAAEGGLRPKRKRSGLNTPSDGTSLSTKTGETSTRGRRSNADRERPTKRLKQGVQGTAKSGNPPAAKRGSSTMTSSPRPQSTTICRYPTPPPQLRRSVRIRASQAPGD